MDGPDRPTRFTSQDDRRHCRPVHVVWELTLACDLRCLHCGSRAGRARPEELTTAECLRVVDELAELGAREVTLIGGEAYLRRDWLEIVAAIRRAGIGCSLQSGGRHLTDDRLARAAEAGLQAIGISLDGRAQLHDRLRGVSGSFEAAVRALRAAGKHGLARGVNTQLTALVIPDLYELLDLLVDLGVPNWQVQLTVAMGRAADRPELLLQPYQLLEVMPMLADLYRQGVARGVLLQPGNNIGYFGPYESLWRGFGNEGAHWAGCGAAVSGMGLEADGTVKGCPSLPTTPYAAGNVRDGPLTGLWRDSGVLATTPGRGPASTWGFCRTCYYSEVCRGGCTWTTHSLFGRPGNNPYCHHRVLELARRGERERVEQIAAAPGTPFDHGMFSIVRERLDGSEPRFVESPPELPDAVPVTFTRRRPSGPAHSPAPVQLEACRACHRHVFATETVCPHCGKPLTESAAEWERRLNEAKQMCSDLLARVSP
jgi:Y-X(10)_GDL-associated radical SAM protein